MIRRLLGAAAGALTLSAPATAAPPEQCEAIRATMLANAESTLEALDGMRNVLIEIIRVRIQIMGNDPAIAALDNLHADLSAASEALARQSDGDAVRGYMALNELCPIEN